ncbi:DUF697 domain-containing protein [Roseomonas elaeocarpi]|uniref:DUF697 domain-containing protein n=1 Tax=Roseomonas elaeocarpi TaxID=907779 RepID=A0ABV6JXH8_9PROT
MTLKDGPRIILEEERPPVAGERVDLGWEQAVVPIEPSPRIGWSSVGLVTAGIACLVLGFALIDAVGFVLAQFREGWFSGGVTLLVAVLGFGLILGGVARELRSLAALRAVDRCRLAIVAGDTETARAEAVAWAARVPAAIPIRAELRAAPDAATVRALLEGGPLRQLDSQATTLGRNAAIQAFAATAISPSPAWDALVFGWRAVRLVRQVAELHGLRPGVAATVSLLRRSALSAVAVAATNVLADAATRAVVSNPLIEKLAGEAATGAVAARRMLALARATAIACRIVPPPGR